MYVLVIHMCVLVISHHLYILDIAEINREKSRVTFRKTRIINFYLFHPYGMHWYNIVYGSMWCIRKIKKFRRFTIARARIHSNASLARNRGYARYSLRVRKFYPPLGDDTYAPAGEK